MAPHAKAATVATTIKTLGLNLELRNSGIGKTRSCHGQRLDLCPSVFIRGCMRSDQILRSSLRESLVLILPFVPPPPLRPLREATPLTNGDDPFQCESRQRKVTHASNVDQSGLKSQDSRHFPLVAQSDGAADF